MPPLRSRSGMAHMGAVTSMVAVASAAVFAAAEGLAPERTEPILIGGAISGMAGVFIYLALKIMRTSEMVQETHSGLFHPSNGVFVLLKDRDKREDKQDERMTRHSDQFRAIRDGAD